MYLVLHLRKWYFNYTEDRHLSFAWSKGGGFEIELPHILNTVIAMSAGTFLFLTPHPSFINS